MIIIIIIIITIIIIIISLAISTKAISMREMIIPGAVP